MAGIGDQDDRAIQGVDGDIAPAADLATFDAELAALGPPRLATMKEPLPADCATAPARVFVSTASTVKAKDGKVEKGLAVK